MTHPSDTPRTDAHLQGLHYEGAFTDPFAVSVDFARDLERENTKLREAIAAIGKAWKCGWPMAEDNKLGAAIEAAEKL